MSSYFTNNTKSNGTLIPTVQSGKSNVLINQPYTNAYIKYDVSFNSDPFLVVSVQSQAQQTTVFGSLITSQSPAGATVCVTQFTGGTSSWAPYYYGSSTDVYIQWVATANDNA